MGVTTTVVALALLTSWADHHVVFIAAIGHVATSKLEVTSTTAVPQIPANRTSKELNDRRRMVNDPEAKTTGRKFTSEDYNTFSSLTSDLIVETATDPVIPTPKTSYPALTTIAPTFVTRGRYIRNPFYYSKEDQEVEFEEDHGDMYLNPGMPKWNRYNTNHRQLTKYGPSPMDGPDITVDEDGSAGYGSAFDFGSAGVAPASWSGAAEPIGSWYGDPLPQATRPVPIIAEIRHPAATVHKEHKHKMSVDLTKLALLKLAIIKLKALGAIKAKLAMLIKLKLLLLLLLAKALMLAKLAKLAALLPALLSLLMLLGKMSRLGSLLNQPVLVPSNFGTGDGAGAGGDGGGGDGKVRSTLDPLETMDPGMAYFRQVAQTEKCVHRIACRVAGARRPSLTLIWMNWAVSPISNYIPSKKIRSFVSTFNEVTNYRLDNLYSSLLPTDWTKWCNEHYTCDKENAKKKDI